MSRLRTWDNEHVWHPFTPMQSYVAEGAPIIVEGDGFDLLDEEGRRYLDGFSSLWCNVHGHRVPEIDEAVRRQLHRVAHTTLLGHASAPSIELAKMLVDRAPPGLSKVFYSDSGATAVEVAVKIAFQYHRQKPHPEPKRDAFVRLGEAYHGDTIGSVSVGGIDLFHGLYRPLLFETIAVPSPAAYRIPEGHTRESYSTWCIEELERTLCASADRVAAFILEPLVQGAAGILVHPPGYLTRVREVTRELGILLIADEVAVGFGRTGTMFACEQESVLPDLLCLGKGLTGGYLPLAATLATEEVFAAFLGHPAELRTFFHGHTFTGNALGCAAAIASLDLFDKNQVIRNVQSNEAILRDRLREVEQLRHVGQIRQKGAMVGIELVADRATKRAYPPAERRGHAVTLAARQRGVLTRPLGDVVVLMPAPAMPAEQIHRLCDVIRESILDVTEREPDTWLERAGRLRRGGIGTGRDG